MKVLVLNTKKLKKDCSLDFEYLARIKKTISFCKENKDIELIVISGGKTRANCNYECTYGQKVLENTTNISIKLENKSKTTSESILYTKQLLKGVELDQLFVVSNKKYLLRLKFMYKKLWPKMYQKTTFISAKNHSNLLINLLELVYLLYYFIDPYGTTVEKITKKLFRNS